MTGCDGVDLALEQADDAVQQVLEYKRMLREHRNALIPAARFPQEVLSCVFRELVLSLSWAGACRSNLAFSQVCRRWRAVALEDPRLWTTPASSCPELGKAMITRSKGLPLIINVQCYSQRSKVFKWGEAALANLERIQRLNIVASRGVAKKLAETLTGALPVLEDLNVIATTACHLRPSELERSETPLLRRVCLTRCTLPVHSKCLRSLTTLQISLFATENVRFAGIADIVEVVKNNPAIERLVLKNITNLELSQGHVKVVGSPEKTILKSLKFFVLEEGAATMCAMLSSFAAPNLEHLHLLNPDFETNVADFTGIVEALEEWLQGPLLRENMESIMFEMDEWGLLQFAANPPAPVLVALRPGPSTLRAVIDTFVRCFPVDRVLSATFVLELPAADFAIPLLNKFATQPKLRSITLEEHSFMAFVACIEQIPRTSESSVFPALEKLILRDCVIEKTSCGSEASDLHRLARAVKRLVDEGRHISVTIISPECPINPVEVFKELDIDIAVQNLTRANS